MNDESIEPDGTIRDGLRLESDSMGKIWVPADRYWGAQTQRALIHFSIGRESMPGEVITALALLKQAAARANRELGRLPEETAGLIDRPARR